MKCVSGNNPKYISAAKWCLNNMLHMKSYNIVIKEDSFPHSPTIGLFASPNTIRISRKFNPKYAPKYFEGHDPLHTLFHEIRHYFQFHTKMFTFVIDEPTQKCLSNALRKNNHIKYCDIYEKLPWEIDANNFADKAINRIYKVRKLKKKKEYE